MRKFLGLPALSVLLLATNLATASEDNVLTAVENGTIKLDSEVALPSGDQSAPAPGWGKEPASFIVSLNKAEEKAIVDKAYPLLLAKWPFNALSACWENPTAADAAERRWVQQAVERTWQKHSALKFLGWATCAPNNLGIRIFIEDSGPHTKGLGKFLSGKPKGMVLNFTFQTWSPSCHETESERRLCIESIAVHEFGHAIGFAHEQNRPDTPGECKEPPQGSNGDTTSITPWDPHSVMNYCNSEYNNNGELSAFDIKAVQYIYGLPH